MSGDYPSDEKFAVITISQRYVGESAKAEVYEWYHSLEGAMSMADKLYYDKSNIIVATYVVAVVSSRGSVT